MAHTERMPALDKAAIRRAAGDGDGEGAYLVTRTEVEETKAFLYILPVFLVVCLYQVGRLAFEHDAPLTNFVHLKSWQEILAGRKRGGFEGVEMMK